MMTASIENTPQSILFMCNYNSVRSPMAECLAKSHCGTSVFVDSVGIRADLMEVNHFSVSVMEELGLDLSNHKSKHFHELNDTSFDLVIALNSEAHRKAIELTRVYSTEVEYWPIEDPTTIKGSRENIMAASQQGGGGEVSRQNYRE